MSKPSISYHRSPLLKPRTLLVRSRITLAFLTVAFVSLLMRAMWIQIVRPDFYIRQGEKRYEHTYTAHSSRGRILDQNGAALAVNEPIFDTYVVPSEFRRSDYRQRKDVANLLALDLTDVTEKVNSSRQFIYLKRKVTSDTAVKITALDVPGLYLTASSRRYYPIGSDSAQLVGFTGSDGHGLEGVERAFETTLASPTMQSTWIVDRRGRPVELVRASSNGVGPAADIELSIDRRIQHLAIDALSSGIEKSQAKAGCAVVVDANTGEILALVNLPTFDPNEPVTRYDERIRNRALDDAFEPGSTIKPVTVALALARGVVTPETLINTSPGIQTINGVLVHDVGNFGTITVSQVISKSSNIGMAHIAGRLTSGEMWAAFHSVGVGERPLTGSLSGTGGYLRPAQRWRPVEQMTMAYGYGLSTSLAQLADIYTVFAGSGERVPLTLLKRTEPAPRLPFVSADVAAKVREILAEDGRAGTARVAALPDYQIAGKTGTARKHEANGYAKGKYRAFFVGFAPVSRPRLIVAVMIEEPSKGSYYGGPVSGPVFAQIMQRSLHLLGVPPDKGPNAVVH